MITIGKLVVTREGDKARLSADIEVDGVKNPLWMEVDARYEKYLCAERCDAYVLGLLHWAMKNGQDIRSTVPMTDRLYEQLTTQFLPAFAFANNLKKAPKIDVPLAPEVEHPEDGCAIGTGCSCGVDSLHVYAQHANITHACVWNVHGVTSDETEEKRKRGWENLVKQAERFAKAAEVELIVGDSNFDRGCIPTMAFDGSISYGNLFYIFALQKLWKTYYVASGYAADHFDLASGVKSDPAHYEFYLFSFCSLKNISVRLDGVETRRIDKVRHLVEYPLARKFLNVCWEIAEDGRNCTFGCAKCMRTILELYALDALDDFSNVFDVAYVKAHQEEYLAEYYRGLIQRNPFAYELKPYFASRKIATKVRLSAVRIVLKKIAKKLLRGGSTRAGKFTSRG